MDHGCQVRGSVGKGLVARKIHFGGDEHMPIGDVRISTSHAVIRHICEGYNPGHFWLYQGHITVIPFPFSRLVQVIRKRAHVRAHAMLRQPQQPTSHYIRDNVLGIWDQGNHDSYPAQDSRSGMTAQPHPIVHFRVK